MEYQLGVDLGTTYTAAAVGRDGRVEIATLGSRTAAIPSVVFLREDETVLIGEAASRRSFESPERAAKEFKRRLGDTTPLFLAGSPFSPQALTGKLLRWVVDVVAQHEGRPPSRLTVTHPANWGPFRRDLFAQALRLADVEAAMVTEPEAAAIYYATGERLAVGAVIAVYDLGGGTFDAAVLRRTEAGFEVLGNPEGIEHLGGIDIDDALVAHVDRSLQGALSQADPDDPLVSTALSRVREECILAKEALSSDTSATIAVLLPNRHTEVRVTRAELEAMIRPTLADTMGSLRRAMQSAEVRPEDVAAVLLVGGSSRIPLVADLVSAELGRPVVADAHPKHAIALGAAVHAAQAALPQQATEFGVDQPEPAAPAKASLPAAWPTLTAPPAPPAGAPAWPVATPSPQPPPPSPVSGTAPPSAPPRRSKTPAVAAGVVTLLLVLVGVVFLLGGGDKEEEEPTSPDRTEPTGLDRLEAEIGAGVIARHRLTAPENTVLVVRVEPVDGTFDPMVGVATEDDALADRYEEAFSSHGFDADAFTTFFSENGFSVDPPGTLLCAGNGEEGVVPAPFGGEFDIVVGGSSGEGGHFVVEARVEPLDFPGEPEGVAGYLDDVGSQFEGDADANFCGLFTPQR